MKEPWFWRDASIAARLARAALAPLSFAYDAGQRLRRAIAPAGGADAPVICVGNASLGGVGKTPFALMLAAALKDRGLTAHFSSRGYGGALRGPVQVARDHRACDVGDEALLLAAAAPTWIAKDRLAGARAAAAGADVVIMDDGFQNPSVRKAVSLLVVDAADPGEDARVFPAGPMREPLNRAIARADAIIQIGKGAVDPQGKPLFRAATRVAASPQTGRVLAFCGIGNPARFFASLESAGFEIAGRAAFADHHPYDGADLAMLRRRAAQLKARLVTTEKDFVRLSPDERRDIEILKIEMTLDDWPGLVDLILTKAVRPK